jgi:hypothetical protein
MQNARDLTGLRSGRLVVASRIGKNKSGNSIWECRCDCGTVKPITSNNFLCKKPTQSCGCLLREASRARRLKHGKSGTGEYNSWKGMFARCDDPLDAGYKNYGGRGIKICERWRVFENFLADMGPRPIGTTLDRHNNNKGYEPANCRWATWDQQANNRRTCRVIDAHGKSLTVQQWAKETGIKGVTIRARIKSGWDPIRAISTPPLF